MNPFKYRPKNEDDPGWEDNWISNALAYASDLVIPNWCSNEDGWPIKLTLYLWADCSCCLLFRGIVLGAVISMPLSFIFGYYTGE